MTICEQRGSATIKGRGGKRKQRKGECYLSSLGFPHEEMRYCLRCKERWFDIQTQPDGVCKRCHQKDDKKKQDEPFFYSVANHLDFGDVPAELPQFEPIEEMLIARVEFTFL
jgi:uncharacterized protein DUF6570